MICTKVKKFSPFGRKYLEVHPQGDTENTKYEVWVINSKDEKTPEESEVNAKHFYFCHTKRNKVNIYANKSVLVWSKGCGSEERQFVQKCYNVDHDVIELKWCHFKHLKNPESECRTDKNIVDKCLCALESTCVDIFREDGSVCTAPLPFKVERIWSLPNGFCVQRLMTSSEEQVSKKGIPTLFSLIHPLDDFCPAVFRYPESKKSFYFTDTDQHIVFTSPDLPLMVTYDSAVGLHSIWKVREATALDKPDPVMLDESPTAFPPSFHLGQISSRAHSRLSGSPYVQNNRYSFSPSPSASRSRQQSPSRAMSPVAFAWTNSPSLASHTHVTKAPSPHSAIMHESSFSSDPVFPNFTCHRSFGRLSSPLFYRLPSEDSVSISEDQELESMPPNLCLEHLWLEDDSNLGEPMVKADTVFVTEDNCEQAYLCMLIAEKQTLRVMELDTNAITPTFNFRPCVDIEAKQAGPLKSLKMMVIFHPSGDLLLYSGSVKICSLNTLLRIDQLLFEENLSPALELLRTSYSTVTHDVPRNRSPSLNEVQPAQKHDIVKLRDFNKNTFTLALSNETMYHVTVPELTGNELVLKCMKVIQENLIGAEAISLTAKYYVTLNEVSSSEYDVERMQWMKFVELTLMLMGFPEKLRKSVIPKEGNSPAPPEPKKPKKSESFSQNQDWNYVLECGLYPELDDLFQTQTDKEESPEQAKEILTLNSNMPLYGKIPKIFHDLHLLHEDFKLNVLSLCHRKDLSCFLLIIARSFKLDNYCQLLCRDFDGHSMPKTANYVIDQDQIKELHLESAAFSSPINLEKYLFEEISLNKVSSDFSSPYRNTQLIMKCLNCISSFVTNGITASPDSMISDLQISDPSTHIKQNCAEKLLEILAGSGFTTADLERLPFGLALVFQEIFHSYRYKAPFNLSHSSALLLGREDLAASTHALLNVLKDARLSKNEKSTEDEASSADEIFKFRFNCDLRIEEVKRLLDSSKPVSINVVQRPEVSDHDFNKEQETRLLILSKRTMALSIGRGMFTLGTRSPMISETVNIPPLEMNGKASQGKVITLSSQTDLPADLVHWPSFHNGVAAGLEIASGNSQIDSTWIVYNKLKYKFLNEELAGFIMALGLSGHLSVMPAHLIHDYLSKAHEFTSVALLLGIAASKCGTKDANTYKLLAVHIDALLPPTALEVNIPHSAQVAAILGTGLLYLETSERHLVKILLQEIGRPPGPEMENAVNRESHSLTAGFALGMVMLGKGADSLYLTDLKIAEELHHFITGGQQRELPTYLKEVFKSPSYLIKEDNAVNIDVTCPSAIMALSLIYLKTNNRVVSNWLICPETTATLDNVKPDNLLLMMLARGLILWNETIPSVEWVESHLPDIFDGIHFDPKKDVDNESDAETLRLCYCCVLAGCCLALGIKFAGSANKAAFNTLLHYTKKFKKIVSTSIFDKGGKAIGEMCLDSTLLSLSTVMAGSGNLEVLKIARSLRKRANPDITYGTHLATHMAIGFLFLGGGRYTLATNNKAVAGLLCALYPKFPCNSRDNRHHLQALRHLYILACEPRLVIPRDIDSGSICYAPLLVKLKKTSSYPASTLKLLAPCFMPEFSLVSEIQVLGPRYWPITIDFTDNRMTLDEAMDVISCLYVKRKAGYLSYSEDPKGHRNLMARTFTGQSEKLDTITSFSSSSKAALFAELFCSQEDHNDETDTDFFSSILFECVSKEKLEILQTYMTIEKILKDAQLGKFSPEEIHQLQLILVFYDVLYPKLKALGVVEKPLINENYLIQSYLRLQKSLPNLINCGILS